MRWFWCLKPQMYFLKENTGQMYNIYNIKWKYNISLFRDNRQFEEVVTVLRESVSCLLFLTGWIFFSFFVIYITYIYNIDGNLLEMFLTIIGWPLSYLKFMKSYCWIKWASTFRPQWNVAYSLLNFSQIAWVNNHLGSSLTTCVHLHILCQLLVT